MLQYADMQVIILAAGKGTRMGNLTANCPKPMLEHKGKNLLEHKLDILPPEITEIILVVGYQQKIIREYFGHEYAGRPIRYVEMAELRGTGQALFDCRDHVSERFVVMMGDDIYDARDLQKMLHHENAMLAMPIERKFYAGNLIISSDGFLQGMDDEPGFKKGFLNTGMYVLTRKIFEYELQSVPGSNELGLPQTVAVMAQNLPIKVLQTENWHQITSPEDLCA